MLYINFKQGFLESKDSASWLNCSGDTELETKSKGGIFFFFLVGLEELFCFAFVRVSMETPLLEMCSSSQLSPMQAEERPEAVLYFSAAMSWWNQAIIVIFIKKSVNIKNEYNKYNDQTLVSVLSIFLLPLGKYNKGYIRFRFFT